MKQREIKYPKFSSKEWKEGRKQLLKDFPELKKKYKHYENKDLLK